MAARMLCTSDGSRRTPAECWRRPASSTTVTGYSELGDPTGITTTIPAVAGYGTMAGDYTYKPDGYVATTTYPQAADLPAEAVVLQACAAKAPTTARSRKGTE